MFREDIVLFCAGWKVEDICKSSTHTYNHIAYLDNKKCLKNVSTTY